MSCNDLINIWAWTGLFKRFREQNCHKGKLFLLIWWYNEWLIKMRAETGLQGLKAANHIQRLYLLYLSERKETSGPFLKKKELINIDERPLVVYI